MADVEEKVTINLSDRGAVNLAVAILNQASRDYIANDNGRKHDDPTAEVTNFIHSKWFEVLSMSTIDPDKAIERLKIRRAYYEWRKKTGCPHCKKKIEACPHKRNEHYTIFENGMAFCPKKTTVGLARRKKRAKAVKAILEKGDK